MKNQHFQLMLKNSSIVFLLFLCMSCNTTQKHIDIQGHRGFRGLFPENSLPAFEKAIDLGVHTLELDIVISKDNKVVVSHEPFMNPVICYNPKGEGISDTLETQYNLYQMDYDAIKRFDCGSKFHPHFPDQKKLKLYKPLLSEVFDLVSNKNSEVKFNIEIKTKSNSYGVFTPEPKAYVALVLDVIEKHNMMSRVNLQSFNLPILEEIKKQSPNMTIALLIEDYETIDKKLEALSYKPEILSPAYSLLSAESVKNCIILK